MVSVAPKPRIRRQNLLYKIMIRPKFAKFAEIIFNFVCHSVFPN
jgi:hypothetical protein